ncbi:Dihydroorotate dehydrogenase (quinone), mitochondrial [Coemansia javaensis]|uniref:Dihydroorotate dehydrogenase (quinone), mitochondrial n=1 Tax=Coemansia javaensis TaxID=2761396 RepID=A0A9W8LMH6_9FUNG|nr:Dihydroorotate dehydrogenase (quinone), mitochondrial [Coemansia javaensis]
MFRIGANRLRGAAAATAAGAGGRRAFGTGRVLSTGRAAAAAAATAAACGLGYLYVTDASAGVHRYVAGPVLRLLDPEDAHDAAVWLLRHGVCPADRGADDALLETELWGRRVANPVGLAAGFDKNAVAVDALFGLGFGAVEVGSITPQPQAGNARPRLFRIDDSAAVVNRMGLNNDGAEACADRLRSRFWRLLAAQSRAQGETVAELARSTNRSGRAGRLLGVNLGKNKAAGADSFDDYVSGLQQLGAYADYVVINVSCPNVTNIAANADVAVLEQTVAAVVRARNAMPDYRPPVVLKIGPDNSADQLRLIAQLATDCAVDGIIAANTTPARPPGLADPAGVAREQGGLSGAPLRARALETTRQMYRLTGGRIPIIGCGGISSAEDALAFARAGASMVQIYTSMVYDGPGKAREIKDDLMRLLKGRRWADVVGEEARGK